MNIYAHSEIDLIFISKLGFLFSFVHPNDSFYWLDLCSAIQINKFMVLIHVMAYKILKIVKLEGSYLVQIHESEEIDP